MVAAHARPVQIKCHSSNTQSPTEGEFLKNRSIRARLINRLIRGFDIKLINVSEVMAKLIQLLEFMKRWIRELGCSPSISLLHKLEVD